MLGEIEASVLAVDDLSEAVASEARKTTCI
jgi:hypothetical protein